MGEERIRGEELKGHLALLALAVIEHQPRHGYDIMKTLAARSQGVFELGQGTIYPLLYSLEEAGLIKSATQTVDGRRRRVYSLTRPGRKSLAGRKKRWDAFQAAVTDVLQST